MPLSHNAERGTADDCTLVLIGALGDLARRKLYPALYRLAHEGLLGRNFTLLGVDRMPDADASYATAIGAALAVADDTGGAVDPASLARLTRGARYIRGDLTDPALYQSINSTLQAI